MTNEDALAELRRQHYAKLDADAQSRAAAHSAALEARLDEPGFVLLAGENTAVVAKGTLRECRDNLFMVRDCPRDPQSGLGCWVIVDAEAVEVQSGTFDEDVAY